MTTIRSGEGFTVEQILNSNGFTLDTSDFLDLYDDNEELDYAKTVQLNNEEMLRFLNLEDETDDKENNESENTPFVGISFSTLKPKMHSIYNNGEILKLVKKNGVGEVVPKDAQVTVEYVGYFEYQDEPFDSTLFHREKKTVLRLGKGEMIRGLEIGIGTMRKYEKALFLIQPDLAYGKLGCLPRIPANSEVLFKVELVDYLDNGAADLYNTLSREEKRQFSVVEKIVRDVLNTATDYFKRDKVKQAIREYNRAVDYLENAHLENDEEENNMNKLLTRVLSNLMICYNKVNKPKLVCASFQRLPTTNLKAHFNYGKALIQLGEYDKAMDSLQHAYKLSSGAENVYKEIQKVEEYRKKYKEFSKRFAQNSLRIISNNKSSEFEKVATEMCESFNKDANLMKLEIPQGLSIEEQECIRRVAAFHGLSMTKQVRYDVQTLYLTKKSYYSREMI